MCVCVGLCVCLCVCVCVKCIGGNGSLMHKDYLGSSAYYVSLRAMGGGGGVSLI